MRNLEKLVTNNTNTKEAVYRVVSEFLWSVADFCYHKNSHQTKQAVIKSQV